MIDIDLPFAKSPELETYVRDLRSAVERFEQTYRRELLDRAMPVISVPVVDGDSILAELPIQGIIAPLYRTPWRANLDRLAPLVRGNPTAAFIYPDVAIAGFLCASPDKVVDTLICHLRLPRFLVTQTDSPAQLKDFQREIAAVNATGVAIVESGLNPNPRSGSISVRIGGIKNTFIVTATQTDKRRIGSELVLVTAFDPDAGIITANRADPSSSAGMHAMLYQADPRINAVIHVHCRIMTYSDCLSAYRTRRFVPDGFSESFAESVDDLVRDGFAVLRGHGEIAVGATLEQALERLQLYKSHSEKEDMNYAVYSCEAHQRASGQAACRASAP